MALIKCEECGKQISDRSKACIHCGCPLEEKKEEKVEAPEIELLRSECDQRAVMIYLMVISIMTLICILTVIGIILLPVFIYMIYYTLTAKKEYIVLTNKRVHGINWGLKKEKFDLPLSKVKKLKAESLLGTSYLVLEADGKSYTFDYLINAKDISNAYEDVKK